MFLESLRGFRDPARVAHRQQLLETAPGVQPLRVYRDQLIARRVAQTGEPVYVPDFDPADGASTARILSVLEAPGPMTNSSTERPGSGFVSVDNNDATAANLWAGRDGAGLDSGCLAWNIVPWYLGVASNKPNAIDLRDGALELARLLKVLPALRVVVLHGAFAQRGWLEHTAKTVDRPLHVAGTWHPSPLALNTPLRRQDFSDTLAWAAMKVQGGTARE